MERTIMTMRFKAFLYVACLAVATCVVSPAFSQERHEKGDVDSILKLTKGLSKLVNAPKSKDASKNESEQSATPIVRRADDYADAKRAPIPKNAGVFLTVPSIKTLDDAANKFFQQTSDAGFSVLGALKLTDYRRALDAIDNDSELAVAAFCDSAPLKFAILLPIKQTKFTTFVNALAQTTPKDKRALSIAQDAQTANFTLNIGESTLVVARQVDPNYVALVKADDAEILNSFVNENYLDRTRQSLPPSLKNRVLALEATQYGLIQLTAPERPFWREVNAMLEGVSQTLQEMQAEANLTEIREYVRQNIASIRLDLSIDDYGLYCSTQTVARQGSEGEKRIASYPKLSPLNTDADRFFVVLPEVEAPLAGQSEIAPLLANNLPKPFNRLRFIEYSLNLPLESELAAESWQFYLEVDDAEEFVKEMIVPKAREIGGYIGAKQVEDVGSQIFGAIAERRMERQTSRRRPPRRIVDPEEAAARGAALGNLIGNAIGADSGEQIAMKSYKFDDYKMYISDLETYARQSKLKRAEEAGLAPYAEPQLLFSRNRPLLSALDVLIANVQNGDSLQNSLLRSANERAEEIDNSPLFARKSNIIVLDKNRLLIGLGNEDLLRYAVNNWKSLTNPSIHYLSTSRDVSALTDLKRLCAQIPNLSESKLISAIRIDLPSGQAYYRWIAEYYLPTAPKWSGANFPDNMPKAVLVSTLEGKNECVRLVAPHKTLADAFKTIANGKTPLQLIFDAQKNNNPQTTEEDGTDLDDVFNE